MFLFSVFLAATAAIGYEILAAATLVNLLGSSVFYFSLTIGVYLSSLGLGAWLSARIQNEPAELLRALVYIESGVAVLGGSMCAVYYWLYAAAIESIRVGRFESFAALLSRIANGEVVFNFFAFGVLFLVGVLVGFELPLFSRFLASDEKLGSALGRAFFWDYAGALAASIALPIFLFPRWGLVRTSFFLGFLNALAAVVVLSQYLRRFRSTSLNHLRTLLLPPLVALVATAAGFFWADRLEVSLQQKLYGDREILYHRQTPYQGITYTRAPDGKVSLYLSGQLQFESGRWETVYHESLVHPAFLIRPQARRILVLGGGDGLALREILKYPSVERVTLVDIDAEMVAVARSRSFIVNLNQESFSDTRVTVVVADAFKFVELDSDRYDLVFIDFPDAQDESVTRLYTKEFYLNLRRRLAEGGLATIQSSSYLLPVHRDILATATAAGLQALPYRSSDSRNGRVLYGFGYTLASADPIQPLDFKGKKLAVSTAVLKDEKVLDLFTPGPAAFYLQRYHGYSGRVNSVFRPIIPEAEGNVFVQRYLGIVSPNYALRQTLSAPPEPRR